MQLLLNNTNQLCVHINGMHSGSVIINSSISAQSNELLDSARQIIENTISRGNITFEGGITCAVEISYPIIGLTTSSPTTSTPTEYNPSSVTTTDYGATVNLQWLRPEISSYFLADPYSRFEISATITVDDPLNIFGINKLCQDCFIWQYKESIGQDWIDIDLVNNPQISSSITKDVQTNIITNTLTMQTGRIYKAGYCGDINDNHRIFQPDNLYEVRLKVISVNNEYIFSDQTEAIEITSNSLPTATNCEVPNINNIFPSQPYNLYCDSNQDLVFNALIDNVLMNNEYVSDPTSLQSIAPAGNTSITMLIRNTSFPNAISCISIDARFKTFAEITSDPNVTNASQIAQDALKRIENATKSTTLSEDPDVAVALYSVVNDIYQTNLSSRDEASGVVEDIVSNIVTTSFVSQINETLDVDINNTLDLGAKILNEIAMVSVVTSNEEIISNNSSFILIEDYLPNLLNVVPILFGDDEGQEEESQDTLYSISEQSQRLIVNLENSIDGSASDPNTTETTNILAQRLVDSSALSASQALLQANAGESFNYEFVESMSMVIPLIVRMSHTMEPYCLVC